MKFKRSCLMLLTILSLAGSYSTVSANTQPKRIHLNSAIHVNRAKQYRHQNNKHLIKKVRKQVKKSSYYTKWYRDGLNKKNFKAREWVVSHESGHRWNILSYGHICVGYFQLDPHYLGYKQGKVNLNHKHQVKVADKYVKSRYGNWVNAQHFWATHNWY